MAKRLCFILCLIMVFGAFAFSTGAASDIKEPTDVPKVFITTFSSISMEYIDCHVEIIDEEGGSHETIYDSKSKVKIRGNSTSSGAKKPFNIKFSAKTDVLGMGKNKKWCLLANCYERTLIRNQTVFDLAERIGLAFTPSYRVVDVYLNNQFLGSYLLTDAVEASETRVDIDTEGMEFVLERDARTDEGRVYFETERYGLRLGINEPEKPTAAQYNWLMRFLKDAETALYNGGYEKVQEYFDIESMVDFYIILELFKNVDVNTGSTRFYIKDGKIYGGPCWDFDLSSGNCSSSYYTTYNNIYTTGNSWEGLWCECLWFKPLLKYPGFKQAVYARYLELQDTIINLFADNVEGRNYIDTTVEKYWGTISRNYNEAGWQIDRVYSELERVPDKTYEENLEFYRSWLEKRNNWLLEKWGLDAFADLSSESGLEKDGYFLYGLTEKRKSKEVAKMFDGEVTVSYNGKTLSRNDYVCNGSAVSAGGASYGVIIYGDIAPDGVINHYDYIMLRRVCADALQPTIMQSIASDVNGDGERSDDDFGLIKRHCMENSGIFGEDK